MHANVVKGSAIAGGALVMLVACGGAEDSAPSPAAETAPPAVNSVLTEMPAGAYDLDKTHAYISFSYSHLGFSNPLLGFTEFDVETDIATANPSDSSIAVTIAADSIYSRVAKFDDHLKSEDLFDTSNYPQITFTADSVAIDGSDFTMTGPLTIKGIANEVTFTGAINKAADHPMRKVPTLGVSASATVNRSDWGLTLAVPAVGDAVTIDVEFELTKREAS
ncbi:MAG: YceI family protein [Pseudomonadota bacterium]